MRTSADNCQSIPTTNRINYDDECKIDFYIRTMGFVPFWEHAKLYNPSSKEFRKYVRRFTSLAS